MRRRKLIAAAALAPCAQPAQPAQPGDAAPLADLLHPFLARHALPALAAAVVRDGHIIALGAIGTRRVGVDAPVAIDDRFHIGSDTKAMTALLAAILVEQGRLRWDSPTAEIFPELAASMTPGLRKATLEQLLSHTAGIPSRSDAFNRLLAASRDQDGLNLDEQRYAMLRAWCPEPLAADPGTTYAYSNLGYVIAGAMLERVTARTWEELLTDRLFTPLGLTTAGFGPQATIGRTDAPLGHRLRPDGTLKPILAGPAADNPPALGPAGTVHLSIPDFATWAAWNLAQGHRNPALVRPETLRKLHTPVIDIPNPTTPARSGYALGWITIPLPNGRGTMLTHTGSNTLNTALIVLEPTRNFGLVAATNTGGEHTAAALETVVVELYKNFDQK